MTVDEDVKFRDFRKDKITLAFAGLQAGIHPELDLIEALTNVIDKRASEILNENIIEPVYCSCGEVFDWENWDRKTFPVPKGLHESIRHLDKGHKLMSEEVYRGSEEK